MRLTRPDWLYFGALAILAAGLPHANLFMSIGTILLLLVWLGTGGFSAKFHQLRKNKPALLLIALFGMHVVWLFNTSDFDYALKDLRVKLPLLVIPLVLGSVPLPKKVISLLFTVFWIACGAAILLVIFRYLHDPAAGIADPRSLVQGISHIRLSLMMVLLVFWLALHFFSFRLPAKVATIFSVAGAFIFFHLLQSVTGIAILFTTLAVVAIVNLVQRRKIWRALGIAVLVIALVGFSLQQVVSLYRDYFTTSQSLDDLPEHTAAGNPYTHYKNQLQVENGHYVWMNVNYQEMTEAWNTRSQVKINFYAPQTDVVEASLIRYLTSKGLPKDKEGVEALTERDIRAIENGVPSVVYRDSKGLMLRLHKVLFDLHLYLVYGDPSGNSVSQRLVYWQTGAQIFQDNWLLGVGTGDVPAAFTEMYETHNTKLKPEFWRRTHNQFLTFLISFGVAGLLFIVVLLWPFAYAAFRQDLMWIAFITIAILSCLTEDTLETQAGVTFFSFFYMLLANRLWFHSSFSSSAPPGRAGV